MSLMSSHPRMAAVGALMSCENAVHLQSWAILLDWRVVDIFEHHYDASCSTWDRLAAIEVGEVSPYASMLEKGYAMASVYPSVHYHDQSTPLTEPLRKTLNDCKNPLGSPRGAAVSEWPSLSTVGFVKFGGEPWRADFFSDAYTEQVSRATWRKLGTRGCPRPDDDPPQPSTREPNSKG